MTTATTSKTDEVRAKTPAEMSASELYEEGVALVRKFLTHRGYSVLDEEFQDADVIFFDPEDDTTVLARLSIGVGEPEDEVSIPPLELDSTDVDAMRRCCFAYASVHPDCSCVRADVISLTLMDTKQGRIRHLIGAYMWEE